jgi:poly-gamma-glutamate synthesis protein (capsule biosynthesis protein)
LVLLIGFTGRVCYAEDLPGQAQPVIGEELSIPEITFTAVGDVVMHLPIVDSGFNPVDKSYDFRPVFSEIKPGLEKADVAVGILEAPLAGPETKYTGYPLFNSPDTIANALQWAGLDLVFIAHNHCLDRGITGLQRTMAYLDKIGLPYAGCNNSPAQKRYRIVMVKGIKLAFLSYTTTTNGIDLPASKRWMVNRLDYDKIGSDIADARQNGADGIILALHTGIEYQRYPSTEQQQMVNHLFELGADIILGSHVHVVQPIELRNMVVPESGKTRTCFVAYSLGNFLSNQRWRYSDCGLMVDLILTKIPGETGITIISKNYTPLWVNRFTAGGKLHYRIKPLNGMNIGADPEVDLDGRIRMKQVWEETNELLNNWGKK